MFPICPDLMVRFWITKRLLTTWKRGLTCVIESDELVVVPSTFRLIAP